MGHGSRAWDRVRARRRLGVVDRVWTAVEIAALTPAEQDALFRAGIVRDLDQVPPEFLARVRGRLEDRIARQQAPRAS